MCWGFDFSSSDGCLTVAVPSQYCLTSLDELDSSLARVN
jgi:hypothetical protein